MSGTGCGFCGTDAMRMLVPELLPLVEGAHNPAATIFAERLRAVIHVPHLLGLLPRCHLGGVRCCGVFGTEMGYGGTGIWY